MSDYTFFTVEQYDQACVLTWTNAAAMRALLNGELRVELQAFVSTTKPSCVVVSFSRLARCPSSLIGGLVQLNRQLIQRGSRLKLCEMNPPVHEQFTRLHLDRVFEIHGPLSDAIAACDESNTEEGQHSET